MKIVYCSAEVAPFSKAGGLADVSLSLPKAIAALKQDIKVITPLYSFIPQKYTLELATDSLAVPFSSKVETISLYKSYLPQSKVEVFFVKHPLLYRKGIYVNENGTAYPDGAQRFIFFSRAIFSVLDYLKFYPDILHINDWHTAIVPYYLKTDYSNNANFSNTRTVFTIHNIGYQGIFTLEEISAADIRPEHLQKEFEFWGKCNLMKGGIYFADTITTVSKKYSKEIQTPEYGYGLEEDIKKRRDDLFGIVNGVDYSIWNPETDILIPRNYSFKDLSGKRYCKEALQRELNLLLSDAPLLAIISRLDYQKGLELVLETFYDLMKMDIQFVLLGTGDKKLEESFKQLEEYYPNRASVNIKFDNSLAHKIEAGADIFLMPSRYEPCGLNQMYSMLYGTIPVVRRTGGLADTVKDVREDKKNGTGFVFNNFDPQEFLQATIDAIKLYSKNPKSWKDLMIRAMKQDFSWNKVAREWIEIYNRTLQRKK